MRAHFDALPPAIALVISALLLAGAALTLIGALGLLRLPSFYERMHAPTLATSGGTAGIVIASMLLFSVMSGRLAVHEILIGTFVTVTTPVALMLLGRAALYRDRSEGRVGPAEAEDTGE